MSTAYTKAQKRIKEAKQNGETELELVGDRSFGLGKGLKLTDDDLKFLLPELRRLTNLTTLYLSGNQLTSLPKDFGRLSNLTRLSLSRNQLTTLPDEIGGLSNLNTLSLDENQLTTLPDGICRLSKLTSLSLSRNQLTTLPDEIGELSNLNTLDLDSNQLTTLPSSMRNLPQLEKLHLHDNPALNIPPEILGPTWRQVSVGQKPTNPKDILRYYFEQQEAGKLPLGKRPLNEAKLLLLGQGDVGKTSLVRRLVHEDFNPNEAKTDGINIEPWYITNQRTPNQKIRVNVWDFGGQEIMHATHQFFLTERSLYLIVLKARQEVDANRLDYWLQKVSSYGGNSPILIVLNQIDQHAQELDTRFYEEKYPNLIVGWHKTSCKNDVGIDDLRTAIYTHINALDSVHTPFAASWFNVKTALELMPDNYINRDRYATICYENGVRDPDNQRILLRFMHDLGIALNFDTLQLKETHVLNPHWVTKGVYAVLNDSKLAMEKGVLTRRHLRRILHQSAYRNMYGYIVHIMQEFELCFDAPRNKWLIPDLVSPVEPDTGRWDDVLRFRYHYPNVLEPSIMTRFITRMHERIPSQTFWRTGAIIKLDGNRAHVRVDRDAKQIDIRIKGHWPTRRVLLALIREEFRSIHATIPHLKTEEHVPLPDDPKVSVRYNHLLKLEQIGQKMYFPDGANAPVSVATLLNGIEDPRARMRQLEQELQNVRHNTIATEPMLPQALTPDERNVLPRESILAQAEKIAEIQAKNAEAWAKLRAIVISVPTIATVVWLFIKVDFGQIESALALVGLVAFVLTTLGIGIRVEWLNLPKKAYEKAKEKHYKASLEEAGFDQARYDALNERIRTE